jgi:uncharacterized membrane protein YphA (DoxX/SURF4 family)
MFSPAAGASDSELCLLSLAAGVAAVVFDSVTGLVFSLELALGLQADPSAAAAAGFGLVTITTTNLDSSISYSFSGEASSRILPETK